MQVQAKAVKRGRARHACWTMQKVHPVWDSLAQTCTGEGCAYRPRARVGSATTPHCDGACGFLKFWSLTSLATALAALWCSLLSWARAECLLAISGLFNMTDHEEPRGDATFCRRGGGGAPVWRDLAWPDSRPSSLVPAPAPSSQLQKILAWITTASRAPAGTHHPWRGGLPVEQDKPAVVLGYTQEAPANLEIVKMDLAAIPSPAS